MLLTYIRSEIGVNAKKFTAIPIAIAVASLLRCDFYLRNYRSLRMLTM